MEKKLLLVFVINFGQKHKGTFAVLVWNLSARFGPAS